MDTKSKMISVRLSGKGRQYLELLQDHLGLSQSDLYELGLRAVARLHGITLPGDTGAETTEVPPQLQDLKAETSAWHYNYCTYEDAAEMLGVSVHTIRYKVKQGELAAYRRDQHEGPRRGAGATPYLRRSDVEALAGQSNSRRGRRPAKVTAE